MNNNPFECPYGALCVRNQQFSYLRFMHAVPNAPSVDIYSNNNLIVSNLSYRRFTEYSPFLPGTYNIKVFPAGKKINPVIDKNIVIPASEIFTLPIIGMLPQIELYSINDKQMDVVQGKAYVRFVHLSQPTPPVDVYYLNNLKLFENVEYKEVTDYIPLSPSNYTFVLNAVNTANRILYVPNVVLRPDRFYSLYLVGVEKGTPPLQLIIPLDGNSYINARA